MTNVRIYETFCIYPRYGGGTAPWGTPSSSANPQFEQQRQDDGFLEVIGCTPSHLVGTLRILPESK